MSTPKTRTLGATLYEDFELLATCTGRSRSSAASAPSCGL
jgi:hypothetical protein